MPNRFKFQLGDIATDDAGNRYIVVDRKMVIESSYYYAIPVDTMGRRIGVPTWRPTYRLHKTGKHSRTGTLRVFRSNQQLEDDVGRGCKCQCCIHVAMDPEDFTNYGRFRFEGDDDEVSS